MAKTDSEMDKISLEFKAKPKKKNPESSDYHFLPLFSPRC